MMKSYNFLRPGSTTRFESSASCNNSPVGKVKDANSCLILHLLCFLFMAMGSVSWAQSSANYAFATGTTGSLVVDMNGNSIDMSTGTTTLVGPGLDANASPLTNIGFDFYLMGNKFAQFSVQDDGLMQL